MIRVLLKFFKVVVLILALMVINPHRVLLFLGKTSLAAISWIAWRLEDFCGWGDKYLSYGEKNFWIFGKKLSAKATSEINELDQMVKKVDQEMEGR